MRLVTFLRAATERIGAVMADGRILDFAAAEARLAVDMLTLIRRQGALMPLARALAAAPPAAALVDAAAVRLLAPVPRPVSLRGGDAFRQHVAVVLRSRGLEMAPEFDLFPAASFSNHLAVTGPGEVQVQDHHLAHLDFGLQVAVVTGGPLKNSTLEEADSAIFGYMVMNGWRARGLQAAEANLPSGPCKGKDFATSLGPWLVTKDELRLQRTDAGEKLLAPMTCDVNGHRLSSGAAEDMRWTFAQILQRTSYGIQMQPGEVIGSGTVGTGCLLDLNGSRTAGDLWLKAGDEVVLEVEGLGRLVNTLVHVPERLSGVTSHLLGGTLPDLYAGTPGGEAGD